MLMLDSIGRGVGGGGACNEESFAGAFRGEQMHPTIDDLSGIRGLPRVRSTE